MPMDKIISRVSAHALNSFRYACAPRFKTVTLYRCQNVVSKRHKSDSTPADRQAIPLTGYWADILKSANDKEKEKDLLDEPLESIQTADRIIPEPSSSVESQPTTSKDETTT